MRRRPHVVGAALLAATLLGCGSGAKELLDTAQLEETQHNVPHARELYEALVKRYPDTPEATIAAKRLEALGDPAPR
jgi:TolA-binding protein